MNGKQCNIVFCWVQYKLTFHWTEETGKNPYTNSDLLLGRNIDQSEDSISNTG